MTLATMDERHQHALKLLAERQVLLAEQVYLEILLDSPHDLTALRALAGASVHKGDFNAAIHYLQTGISANPEHHQLKLDCAVVLAKSGEVREGANIVEALLAQAPELFDAWLLLVDMRDALGDATGALRACYEAVTRAQRKGYWLDEQTTPLPIMDQVVSAIERVRVGKRQIYSDSYLRLRQTFGSKELARVDRALAGYLREIEYPSRDSRQKPKFFFFPDLPNNAYHDPFLHPWAARLQSRFAGIRNEALQVWEEDQKFQNFLELSNRARKEDYLQGSGANPAWEAFFFYRRGKRFDENHARCPQTSAALDSIDLCNISEQAPEICFSVLRPGTHIMPHYGVSNVRLVMHLPLLIPENCALNVIDVGEHHWREGELMLFDDTFQHEAWNRSDSTRIVLLMDCWNPHLTSVERLAMKELIETISGFQLADRAARAHEIAAGNQP